MSDCRDKPCMSHYPDFDLSYDCVLSTISDLQFDASRPKKITLRLEGRFMCNRIDIRGYLRIGDIKPFQLLRLGITFFDIVIEINGF